MKTYNEIVRFAESNTLTAIPEFLGLIQPDGTPDHWPQYTGRRIFLAATEAVENGNGDDEYSPSPKRRVIRKQPATPATPVVDELAGLLDGDKALIPALYLKTGARSARELREFIINKGSKASIVDGLVVEAKLPEIVSTVLDFFDRPHDGFMEWAGFQTTESLLLDKVVEKILDLEKEEIIGVARLLGIVC